MLKYFTFFIILISNSIYAQSVFNAELIKKIAESTETEFIDVLIQGKEKSNLNFSDLPPVTIRYKSNDIYAVRADIKTIKYIAKLPEVKRIEYSNHKVQLMADTCMVRNRIKDIKTGKSPLPQAYDGTGVIVGIIDSGTDFNHPDLKDATGKSRIKFLWDMTKPTAINTPTTFGYGQEWNNTAIDLGQCTHNDAAHYGHGTNSSGIAAGNGYAIGKYEGVAPKADIIVVALDFNRSGYTISDAVKYIVEKAEQAGKPFVINASVGDYYGSHDGTDLETQIINSLTANIPGRVLVAACGNAGSVPYHLGYDITPTDTNFTWISNNSNRIDVVEYGDTNDIKNVFYSVGVNNSSYSNLGRINFKPYNYALNTIRRDTIFNNTNRIGIIESIASINAFGVYELYLSIKADSLNYKWRIEHTGTGRIDSWNFDYITSNIPSVSIYPNIISYKKADTTQTIVSGFQCSDEIIAVANYTNRNQYIDVNNNIQITSEIPGAIAGSSSVGPTRDGRVKPDIAATGANVITCTELSILPNLVTNAPYVVAQGGYHVTAGGTSAASPVVAGLAALYLQKNPTATNRDVKQAITNCAYSDYYTTTNLPNYRWGYGKLDGYAAMLCGVPISTVSIKEVDVNDIKISPNPMVNETEVSFRDNSHKEIKLYNIAGKLILTDSCSNVSYLLKRKELAPGLYLLTIQENSNLYKIKLLVL